MTVLIMTPDLVDMSNKFLMKRLYLHGKMKNLLWRTHKNSQKHFKIVFCN